MGSLFRHSRHFLRYAPHPVITALLAFLGLVTAFGVLTSTSPDLWQAFLPVLLMGLSYGVTILSLTSLFQDDWEDGFLEWWVGNGRSLETYVSVKIMAHWLRLGLPLTGLVGVISGFSSLNLLIGTALTTLTLTMLGAIGNALCLTAKTRGSLLLPLLTLPSGLPMMIVSMAAVSNPTASPLSYATLQGGLLLVACALSLIACPFALRLALR